jgi:predicted transcriptional regulator of viral defense system
MVAPLTCLENTLAGQHGLVTRAQLLEEGLSRDQIHRMLQGRVLQRLRPGVYIQTGTPRTWSQALMAAVLACGEGAFASHSSAARLWGFRLNAPEHFEVTVPRPRRPTMNGVAVHNTSLLHPSDITTRDGVPCTSFERTLCDATADHSARQLSYALDDGLRRQLTTIERMQACVLRLDSGPRRRLTLVQELLMTRDINYEPGGSNAELRVLNVIAGARLPLPVQQHRVRVNGKTYFLDYAYPPCKRFIEYYELQSHGTPSAVAYDSDRITDLASIGWKPMIFTDANSDAEILSAVSQMLQTGLDVVDSI